MHFDEESTLDYFVNLFHVLYFANTMKVFKLVLCLHMTDTKGIRDADLVCQCPEAVDQRCSVKKVSLRISQNSQENTCVRVSFLIKLQLY